MEERELSICIEKLIGVSRVVVRGLFTQDHNGLLSCILDQLHCTTNQVVVLDLMDLESLQAEDVSGIVSVLEASKPGAGIHVVAPDSLGSLLKRGQLPTCVQIYPSLDEIMSSVPVAAYAS